MDAGFTRPVARITGVSHRYGATTALGNVSLELPSGRMIGLIGPDGAGKSTLLGLIAGARKLQAGSVDVFDGSMGSAGHRRAVCTRIAYMPQGLGKNLYQEISVAENLSFFGTLFGLSASEREARIRKLTAATRLLPFLDRPAGKLSGGMKQKLGLCCALIHDPELLILDEPLTGMDPLQRRRTIRFVKDWAKRGRHVIVSSHILHEIEAMTSNILLITNGRILAEGNVHQIRELIDTHPHTVHVKAADPRAIAARVLHDDGVTRIAFDEGTLTVETRQPDRFYQRLTDLAASGDAGAIAEVTSPDDNLQAVFSYLVRQ